MTWIWVLMVVSTLLIDDAKGGAADAVVHSVEPKMGSQNGATRITIHGTGFAESQFNFGEGNEDKGNAVVLASASRAFPCDVHPDGTHGKRVECITRPMPPGVYYPTVYVDGKKLSGPNSYSCSGNKNIHCRFEVKVYNTPTVSELDSTSIAPGTILEVRGKLFSATYKANDLERNQTNGIHEQFIRAYVTGGQCELLDEEANPYTIELDGERAITGRFKCKVATNYIGTMNVTFHISGPYGRSMSAFNLLQLFSSGEIGMIEQYPVITSISLPTGSIEGGTYLTLYGSGLYDRTHGDPVIQIAGADCVIQADESSDTELVCLTPPQVSGVSHFAGNRGSLLQTWGNQVETYYNNLTDIDNLTSSDANYNESKLNQAFSFSFTSPLVGKVQTYFVAPETDEYVFRTFGNGVCQTWISDSDPSAVTNLTPDCDGTRVYKSLTKGQKYYMKMLFSTEDDATESNFNMTLWRNKIRYNQGQHHNVFDEVQVIYIYATDDDETQTIDMSGLPTPTTSTAEVQKISVTTSDTTEKFRLKLHGQMTGFLSASKSADDISEALNGLGAVPDGSVTVTPGGVSGQQTDYIVTFSADLGTWPLIEAVIPATSSVTTVAVTREVEGSASNNKFALQYDGFLSPPLNAGASASDVEDAVKDLFGVGCPKAFYPKGLYLLEDYEGDSRASWIPSYAGRRTIVSDPFCGRKVFRNPWNLFQSSTVKTSSYYQPINLKTYKYVCFAYKGSFDSQMSIRYGYVKDQRLYYLWYTLYVNLSSETWNFTCYNLLGVIENARPDKDSYILFYLRVKFNDRAVRVTDSYIDWLMFAENLPEGYEDFINQRAQPPVTMQSVSVTKSESVYTVQMDPFGCVQPDLLTIRNAPSITVTRTTQASIGVGGTVSVTLDSSTVSFPATANESTVAAQLNTIPGVGKLSVDRQGSCHGYRWLVTWLTNPGKQPHLFTVNTSAMTGPNVWGSSSLLRTGGMLYDPVPIHLLRMYATTPQVALSVNGVPAHCEGSCDFDWTADQTPTATSVSPATGTAGTTMTVQGSGFDATTMENNVLKVGSAGCIVTAASDTGFTCTLGSGEIGQRAVFISVRGKGAVSGGPFNFTYNAGISSITPTSGGLGGGLVLTLNGAGLDDSAHDILIGTETCVPKTISASSRTCIVPVYQTAGSASVTLSDSGSTVATGPGFTYVDADTPYIDSLSTSTGSPFGGETLILGGVGFGYKPFSRKLVQVRQGELEKELAIAEWTDTQLTLTLPPLGNGDHTVTIFIADKGYAVSRIGGTNALPVISVDFTATNFSPRATSMSGGQLLTITGTGFGTDKAVPEISAGDVACNIQSLTNTEAICHLDLVKKVHLVDNSGEHEEYGVGYDWNTPRLTIKKGDYVTWKWAAPIGITDNPTYRVEQTAEASSFEHCGDSCFTSGESTTEGTFTRQFVSTGTYYYWSNYVTEHKDVFFRGIIEVSETAPLEVDLNVKINDVQPYYNYGSAPSVNTTCTPTPSSGCTVTPGNKFLFTPCYDSTVTSISPNLGNGLTVISIQGSGFGTDSDCVDVTIGGFSAVIQIITDTQIDVNIDPDNPPPVGQTHIVQVELLTEGYASVAIDDPSGKFFTFNSHIESVTPNFGSEGGGTTITITGGGFVDDTGNDNVIANLGLSSCDIKSHTNTEIICETTTGSGAVTVGVDVKGYAADTCATASNCVFDYSYTPTLSAVTPDIVNGQPTSLTISASNLAHPLGYAVTVSVTIGGQDCAVSAADASSVTCSISYLPVGDNTLTILVDNIGKNRPTGGLTVQGGAVITSVAPDEGSIEGGTLITISGNGFVDGDTQITIDGIACNLESVTLSAVTCTTAAHAEGTTDLVVISNNGVTYTAQTFTYSLAATPTVTSISPNTGFSGDPLTLTGTGFTSGSKVTIGDAVCNVTSDTAAEIVCTLGDETTGDHDVTVVTSTGKASGSHKFKMDLELSGISPDRGSYGGGQLVTITGKGLSSDASVTLCGNPCQVNTGSAARIVIETPENTGSDATLACDLVVTVGTLTKTLTTAYTYDMSLTPTITSSDRARGGTGGGTTLTLYGGNFGTDSSAVSVEIDSTECVIQTVTDTQIVCVTNAHKGTIKAPIKVILNSGGSARHPSGNSIMFEYVDVWSSMYTWGGRSPPEKGDLVVIPAGMTLLLDQNTPILKMLLIQGGSLIFDKADIELQAENILITDGGLLQIGTSEEPFQHKAIITMHGFLRSPELPIYGAKTLAVRNGTLELHGRPTPVTWTVLAQTASPGNTEIYLKTPVNWQIGDDIIIVTTGGHLSQNETEKHTIAGVSQDGLTVNLSSPLQFKHLGITQDFGGGVTMETRAEVGLLSHNVKFRGSNDEQWHDEIEACPAGFDTGQFATQTCFQGRFGEEIGNDQFGAAIMIHTNEMDSGDAVAHIEHTEITYVGQAFRLGRYPVHFHINGDLTGSYIRGCAIHHTFNRAVNIHNTHNVLVENNVGYNIMGGAFFLEDGIEEGNIFQYNLVAFVKSSSSLLNDDITAAAFWVTQPNNTHRHNHVAGGTHFGFWYRMKEHPEGPSADSTICPRKIPLGEFKNNTVHSVGQYGLWIFEEYDPVEGGHCSGKTPKTAVFEEFTAWNNLRGAETGDCGAVQFSRFTMANNYFANFEHLFIEDHVPPYQVATIKDSISIGHLNTEDHPPCTKRGIVLPFSTGMLVDGITFVNFDGEVNDDRTCSALGTVKIICVCRELCSGYNYKFKSVTYINTAHGVDWEWENQAEIEDLDSTLLGQAGAKAVPKSGLTPDSCQDSTVATGGFPQWSTNKPGVICPPDVDFIRMTFNNPEPRSLKFKDLRVTSLTDSNHTTIVPWMEKRDTEPEGWLIMLPEGKYKFEFMDSSGVIGPFSNFSYSGRFNGIEPGANLVIQHPLLEEDRYDRLQVLRNEDPSITYVLGDEPQFGSSPNGAINFNSQAQTVTYLISDSALADNKTYMDQMISVMAQKCLYANCIVPTPGTDDLTGAKRPDDALFWSNADTWSDSIVPLEGPQVIVPDGKWIVLDVPHIKIDEIIIQGTLEVDYMTTGSGEKQEFTIEAEYIIVDGGRFIAGFSDLAFENKLNVILHGNSSSPPYHRNDGPVIGAKVIAVFGALEFYGKIHITYWTHLASTASPGDTQIVLKTAVEDDWLPGDQIVIAPTGYSIWETENCTIVAVSGATVTCDRPLVYTHLAAVDTVEGWEYEIAAEVGLLTRNIKIIGGDKYGKMKTESFGARVVVGIQTDPLDFMSMKHGYANLSNVEFVNTGQEGYIDSYDPRFSLAFVTAGDITATHPSQVVHCSFNDGFSPAIGVFGTNYLNVTENVIFGTVGQAVVDEGTSNRWQGNLILLNQWPGTYNGRYEGTNYWVEAAFTANKATTPVLKGNVIAGSERAGYRLDGEICGSPSSGITAMTDNTVHSVLIGIYMMFDENDCHIDNNKCSKFANFYVYKAYNYGFYSQTECNVELENFKMVDNSLSIFIMVNGPDIREHGIDKERHVTISDSLFVGLSPSFDCTHDVTNQRDTSNVEIASKTAGGWTIGPNKSGRIGIGATLFSSTDNMAPEKPWDNAKKDIALFGKTDVTGTTFAHFSNKCGARDYVFATNEKNPDLEHRIKISSASVHSSVDYDSRVYIHRPSLGYVNPGDCVDMDCSGKMTFYIEDDDGSYLGNKATLIPDSSFEWNGDSRRGKGDYRVPKTLMTALDGRRLETEEVYKRVGILGTGTSSCIWNENWNAYKCSGYDYEQLSIENMDADFLDRRVDPLAMVADYQIELLNSPHAVGICHGYPCRERPGAYFPIVALGQSYQAVFTGTTPQNLRIYLLHACESDKKIILTMYMGQQYRYDVYHEGEYVLPANAKKISGDRLEYDPPTFPGEFMPSLSDTVPGMNYFDIDRKELSVLVLGCGFIEIKITPSIIVSFSMPTMTEDEFFDSEKLVANLAAFLQIPPDKVRIMEVVAENSVKRKKRGIRHRRQSSGMRCTLEIGDHPESKSTSLSSDGVKSVSDHLKIAAQNDEMSDALGVQVTDMFIQAPPPDVTDTEAWNEYVIQSENGQEFNLPIYKPHEMVLVQVPEIIHADMPFGVQPSLKFVDDQGRITPVLTSQDGNPWRVRATLVKKSYSPPAAKLIGSTEVNVLYGWANFTSLGISHTGFDYKIVFSVVNPSDVSFTRYVEGIQVSDRPIDVFLDVIPDEFNSGESFDATVSLMDVESDSYVRDGDWNSFTWSGTLSLSDVISQNAALTGETQLHFTSRQPQLLNNLKLTANPGYYVLVAMVASEPEHYLLYEYKTVRILPAVEIPKTAYNKSIELKFDYSYDFVDKIDSFLISVYNKLVSLTNNVEFYNWAARQGSIYVDMTCHGSETDVNSAIAAIADEVRSGQGILYRNRTLPYSRYLVVDNEIYEDLNGDPVKPSGKSVPLAIIIPVCVVGGCLLILVIVLSVVFCKKKGKNRLNDSMANMAKERPTSSDSTSKGHINDGYFVSAPPMDAKTIVFDEKTGLYKNGAPGDSKSRVSSGYSTNSNGTDNSNLATRDKKPLVKKQQLSPLRSKAELPNSKPKTTMVTVGSVPLGALTPEGIASGPNSSRTPRPGSQGSMVSRQEILTSFSPQQSINASEMTTSVPSVD